MDLQFDGDINVVQLHHKDHHGNALPATDDPFAASARSPFPMNSIHIWNSDDNIDVAESAARAVSCIDHGQLSDFIHNNCDIPLSSIILNIYSSYLGYVDLMNILELFQTDDAGTNT